MFAHRCDWQGSTVFTVHNLADEPAVAELTLGEDVTGADDLLELREHDVARGPPPGRARRLRVPVAARPAVRGGAQGPTSDRRTYVTSRRAWLMWGLGVAAYGVAVFHRASLGVAGPEAQERFGASAAVLSLFVVLQLAVYAGLQVPVGALLDRVGSRRMVAAGAAVMGIGQIVLAESHSVGLAVAAASSSAPATR